VLLGELLVQSKAITPEQLAEALAAPREAGKKIGQVLIERGWLNEAQLTQTLSLQLGVPWVSLYHIDFSRQLLNRVSRELAERFCLIPIFVRHVKGHGETLYVAMEDPGNEGALQEVARTAGLPARPMIASVSDIRSAIRVYYGDPATDAAPPPTRVEPKTTREGRPQSAPPPVAARRSEPPKVGSQPPPAPPRAASQPPRSSVPPTDPDGPPVTSRSSPPSAAGEVHAEPVKRRGPRMVALTLLDGTTISLPATKGRGSEQGLTARDYVSALRAAAHGADATEILGEKPQWEPVVAALLSILLRKGLIADWEFVEELRKI
jgi:type IV pilus assembly protein PilB